MPKVKSDENDNATERERDSKDSDEKDASDADSATELEPVRPKIGESKDNLRQRADRFQKRHGSG